MTTFGFNKTSDLLSVPGFFLFCSPYSNCCLCLFLKLERKVYFIVFIQNSIFVFFAIIFSVAILLKQKAFTFTTLDHSACYI